MALVSYITVTRNRKGDLRRALASIQKQDWQDKEIWVVDNASEDGTAAMVAQEFPEVKLIVLPENKGAAGGRNCALAQATGEFILCIDDDVELQGSDATQKAVALFAQHPSVGAVTFLTLDPATGEPDRMHIPRKDKQMEAGECCMFIAGGCALRKSALDTVGLFWEHLGAYGGEELDMAYRLIDGGYTLWWTHHITVLHHESKSERPAWRRIYYMARNRPWITVRHLPWQYVIVSTCIWWVYLLLQALKTGQIRWWCKGVAASLKGMGKALSARKPIGRDTVNYYKAHSGSLWW